MRSLYLFEKDTGGKSACYGKCAKVWPPVTTSGAPKAEGKAKASMLDTVARKDGSEQVTYAGHPLYYYAPDDHTAHSAKGQGLEQFGAEWYVLSATGSKVEEGGGGGGY
jgi:predicted lipoprotein with Yx(FWY)xxD motif